MLEGTEEATEAKAIRSGICKHVDPELLEIMRCGGLGGVTSSETEGGF